MQKKTKRSAREAKSTRLVAAAGYIRMSTEQQDASPARQRAEVLQLAERSGYRVVQWYEDHGLTGTESLNRPEFQRMLADAKRGTFRAILMFEQSRFSREDVFDVMQHWRALRTAGVEIVTCGRGKLNFNDLGGLITAIVDQHGAHDESRKIADRSVSGRLHKLRQGKRVSGTALYGFDRLIRDETGREVRRIHFREHFTKPRGWTQELVPSADLQSVDAIRWAFEQVCKGTGVHPIANELNRRGILSREGKTWTAGTVKVTLMNPGYAGILRAGKDCVGKFRRCNEEGLILSPNAHVGLVTTNVFYQVQDRLKGRTHAATPPGRYLLSGIVVCDHCGKKMYGRTSDDVLSYSCVRSGRYVDPNCPRPFVNAGELEKFIIKTIRERILCDENREALLKAAARWQAERRNSFEQDQLDEIRRKLERATENLALADGENFLAISKLLEKWRTEETELVRRIEAEQSGGVVTAEAARAVEMLAKFSESLEAIDRVDLSAAIHNTIAQIRVRTKRAGKKKFKLSGVVQFQPNVCPDGSMPFTHDEVSKPRAWVRIAELIEQSKTAMTASQVSKAMGYRNPKNAGGCYRQIKLAIQAGRVRRHPSGIGFVAASH